MKWVVHSIFLSHHSHIEISLYRPWQLREKWSILRYYFFTHDNWIHIPLREGHNLNRVYSTLLNYFSQYPQTFGICSGLLSCTNTVLCYERLQTEKYMQCVPWKLLRKVVKGVNILPVAWEHFSYTSWDFKAV